MARPEMESRVDDRNPGARRSCRMEVLRQDAWPNGCIIQPCHRHRTIATQTVTVSAPLPHIPTQDAFSSDSVQRQDNPLRDNTGANVISVQYNYGDHLDNNSTRSEDVIKRRCKNFHSGSSGDVYATSSTTLKRRLLDLPLFAGTEQLRERQLPLPDLLTDNQSSSEDSMSSSSSGEDNPRLEDRVVERVAIQLRTIGDEMNTFFLQRNAVPRWQNWRGLYRGLIAFVADTINALYQHGLR